MLQEKIKYQCILDFGRFSLQADLFDHPVAGEFFKHLPYTVELTAWGGELYGGIGHDLGSCRPIPEIPEGGLAYSSRGYFLCIFFGQRPAWPVEYIGRIRGDTWQQLTTAGGLDRVVVSRVQVDGD